MFNSFGENIPRGLLDAIEALLAMQLGLEEETNLLGGHSQPLGSISLELHSGGPWERAGGMLNLRSPPGPSIDEVRGDLRRTNGVTVAMW